MHDLNKPVPGAQYLFLKTVAQGCPPSQVDAARNEDASTTALACNLSRRDRAHLCSLSPGYGHHRPLGRNLSCTELRWLWQSIQVRLDRRAGTLRRSRDDAVRLGRPYGRTTLDKEIAGSGEFRKGSRCYSDRPCSIRGAPPCNAHSCAECHTPH